MWVSRTGVKNQCFASCLNLNMCWLDCTDRRQQRVFIAEHQSMCHDLRILQIGVLNEAAKPKVAQLQERDEWVIRVGLVRVVVAHKD
jgi:hypothetical protein